MDPNECLRNILSEMDEPEPDTERLQELWDALAEWLGKGGFPPVCNRIGYNYAHRIRSNLEYGRIPRQFIESPNRRYMILPDASGYTFFDGIVSRSYQLPKESS